MKKYILLLILLFPTFTFGQSFAGNYQAVFFNLFSEPRTIRAEFEVKTDNTISVQIKIGNEIKTLTGMVDKKGKFEAVSTAEGNMVYQLKGKIDKNNKVSFIRRVQGGSGLNKSVSENGLEGTFTRVEQVETEIENDNSADTNFSVVDNGKSQLFFQHSNQIFGNVWTDFTGQVAFKVSEGETRMELKANVTIDQKQRSIRIYTKPILLNQKIWKPAQIQTASYREETNKEDERNTFLTADHIYAENKELQNGRLIIVTETETQIVFKLANFRIKRFTKEDLVEINGFIYADKVK
jgi:hypothetical protein